nr:hypothetical protein [uncultured Prevotella sp.]
MAKELPITEFIYINIYIKKGYERYAEKLIGTTGTGTLPLLLEGLLSDS